MSNKGKKCAVYKVVTVGRFSRRGCKKYKK